jgi:hypothetical protein
MSWLTSSYAESGDALSPQIAFERTTKSEHGIFKKREPQNDHSGQITLLKQKKAIGVRCFNEKQLCHAQSIRKISLCSYRAWQGRNMFIFMTYDLRDSITKCLS